MSGFNYRLMVGLTFVLAAFQCYGHDWQIHELICQSAYQSSVGLQTFLNENLNNPSALLLSASQPQCPPSLTAANWLMLGSKMEDEQTYPSPNWLLRPVDHFYTVEPRRTPGQVIGLTDASEGPLVSKTTGVGYHTLPSNIVNSYIWASEEGIPGPLLQLLGFGLESVGANAYTWENARDDEYAALASTSRALKSGCFFTRAIFCDFDF